MKDHDFKKYLMNKGKGIYPLDTSIQNTNQLEVIKNYIYKIGT